MSRQEVAMPATIMPDLESVMHNDQVDIHDHMMHNMITISQMFHRLM